MSLAKETDIFLSPVLISFILYRRSPSLHLLACNSYHAPTPDSQGIIVYFHIPLRECPSRPISRPEGNKNWVERLDHITLVPNHHAGTRRLLPPLLRVRASSRIPATTDYECCLSHCCCSSPHAAEIWDPLVSTTLCADAADENITQGRGILVPNNTRSSDAGGMQGSGTDMERLE